MYSILNAKYTCLLIIDKPIQIMPYSILCFKLQLVVNLIFAILKAIALRIFFFLNPSAHLVNFR